MMNMNCVTDSRRWGIFLSVWIGFLLVAPTLAVSRSSKHATTIGTWGRTSHRIGQEELSSQWGILELLRAGATVEEEVDVEIDEEVDSDDEAQDEDSEDEEDEYDEESSSDDEEYESAVEEEIEIDVSVEEYDKQLSPPAGLQMGGLLGVMLLSRRLDMFNPKVVRFARYEIDFSVYMCVCVSLEALISHLTLVPFRAVLYSFCT